MRKVYLGKFIDYKPQEDDIDINGGFDFAPMHIARKKEKDNVTRSAALEYYVKNENGENVIIKDATVVEKIVARLKYLVESNKKSIVGYRTTGKAPEPAFQGPVESVETKNVVTRETHDRPVARPARRGRPGETHKARGKNDGWDR